MISTNKVHLVLSLLICFILLSSVAIVKYGEWMGYKIEAQQNADSHKNETHNTQNETIKINTTKIASDVNGFGGTVPLQITINKGKIVDVKVLQNNESPDFLNRAIVLLEKWKNKDVTEAIRMKVDAVSGATYSSKAIIENMNRGLAYYQQTQKSSSWESNKRENTKIENLSFKNISGLIVVLMAVVLPFFIKNKKYHTFQLCLNVIILGFWCGSFISYSALLNFFSHGIKIADVSSLIFLLMLIAAFIYPLLRKKSYYCNFVCPYGSLQQLLGKCCKIKIRQSKKTLKKMELFRQILWGILMLFLWGGVCDEWINYEPFSAFLYQATSWGIILFALLFSLLSLVIYRPYCRFICPMGTLIRLSQASK